MKTAQRQCFPLPLDDATREQLDHGERVTELMKQKQYQPMSISEQAAVIYASNEGFLADVPVEKIGSFEEAYLRYMHDEQSELMREIDDTANYDDDIAGRLKSSLETFKQNHSY